MSKIHEFSRNWINLAIWQRCIWLIFKDLDQVSEMKFSKVYKVIKKPIKLKKKEDFTCATHAFIQ